MACTSVKGDLLKIVSTNVMENSNLALVLQDFMFYKGAILYFIVFS